MKKQNTTLINVVFFEECVKGTQRRYNGVNYDLKSMEQVKEFLCALCEVDKSTVGKWFTDIDKSSWLGLSEDCRRKIEDYFGVEAHEREQTLFYSGYDYIDFKDVVLCCTTTKLCYNERVALWVMLRRPFSWLTIEDILNAAQEYEPRFKKGPIVEKYLRNRPEFYSCRDFDKEVRFRLRLDNVVPFIRKIRER